MLINLQLYMCCKCVVKIGRSDLVLGNKVVSDVKNMLGGVTSVCCGGGCGGSMKVCIA